MGSLRHSHLPPQFTFQFAGSGGFRMGRLGNDQGCYYAYSHQAGHGEISVLPALGRGNVERAGAGNEQRHPVTEYIAGCHRSLQQPVHGFDAIGIYGYILGRGSERDQQGKDRDKLQL